MHSPYALTDVRKYGYASDQVLESAEGDQHLPWPSLSGESLQFVQSRGTLHRPRPAQQVLLRTRSVTLQEAGRGLDIYRWPASERVGEGCASRGPRELTSLCPTLTFVTFVTLVTMNNSVQWKLRREVKATDWTVRSHVGKQVNPPAPGHAGQAGGGEAAQAPAFTASPAATAGSRADLGTILQFLRPRLTSGWQTATPGGQVCQVQQASPSPRPRDT